MQVQSDQQDTHVGDDNFLCGNTITTPYMLKYNLQALNKIRIIKYCRT